MTITSTDFSIEEMNRHEDGYYYAIVLSHRTHFQYIMHDRWGSWRASSLQEVERGPWKDIPALLAQALQNKRNETEGKIEKLAFSNPFAAAVQSSNPFLTPAQTYNPFMNGNSN